MARLGQLLVRADLVTENNLARALGIQGFAGGRLGTLLLERGSVDEDSLGKTLALQHRCEYVAWRVLSDISPVVIAALPVKFAIKHAAIPYDRGESYLRVALRDPGDLRILDELFFVTGRKIIAGVAPEVRIYQALEKYYGERRTPRYAILAEKISRPMRPSRVVSNAPPPPPEFFPGPKRKPSRALEPQELWGDAAEPDIAEPPIIQSWKLPDQQIGGWAGTVSPGIDASPPQEPETISWEEMPAIPSMWLPEPAAPPPAPARPAPAPPPAQRADTEAEPEPRVWSRQSVPPAPTEVEALPAAAPLRELPAPPSSPAFAAAVAGIPEAPGSPPPASLSRPSEPPPPPAAPEPVATPPSLTGAPPATGLAETAKPIEPPARRREAAEAVPVRTAASASPPSPPPAPIASVPSATDFPEVAAATDRDSIATAALTALARRFPKGAIFVAKPDAVTAWGGAGDGISPEELRDIAIPWTEPSVFLNVRLSRAFYLGPLPPLPRHEAIAIAMGGWPDECLVQPILIREKPVAFLYAEFTREQGATPMDLAYLRELAASASSAFVSAIRLKKKEI